MAKYFGDMAVDLAGDMSEMKGVIINFINSYIFGVRSVRRVGFTFEKWLSSKNWSSDHRAETPGSTKSIKTNR
jgi:hypothetical protein